MLVGDMRGKWRECDPYLTDEMISSVPPAEATLKSSTQVCATIVACISAQQSLSL